MPEKGAPSGSLCAVGRTPRPCPLRGILGFSLRAVRGKVPQPLSGEEKIPWSRIKFPHVGSAAPCLLLML